MKFQILDVTGHSEEAFTKGDKVSMADAEKRFAELTGRRFAAFKADGHGAHTKIKAFDPEAETVLWIPPLAGG